MGVAVAALLALAAPRADAAFPYCTVLTDPAGDVRLAAVPQTEGHVDDGHVDLRAVDVVATERTLVVVFQGTKLDRRRGSLWRLELTSRQRRVLVEAETGGLGAYGEYRASVVDGPTTVVTGTVDYATSTIVVSVPTEVLGSARPLRGTTLSGFVARASEGIDVTVAGHTMVVEAGTTPVDDGTSRASYRVGRTCR